MEREKGFESPIDPVFSRSYDTGEGDAEGSTRLADASTPVATRSHEGDVRAAASPLPAPAPDLFITAGALAAERAARSHAERFRVEEILRRAVDQASALRVEAV